MSTQDFTSWFRRELKRRTWNQSTFNRQSGVPTTTVSSWWRGRSIPDPALCRTIAETFGVTPDYVLDIAGHRAGELNDDDPLRAELHALIDAHPVPITDALIAVIRNVLALDLSHQRSGLPMTTGQRS